MAKTRGTPGQRKRADELVRLAEEEFGELLEGEVKMLRGAAMGEIVDLAIKSSDETLVWDSANQEGSDWGCWESWGSHRIVRSTIIRWMCSLSEAKALVDVFGIAIFHAHIEGELDIDGVEISFRIVLYKCVIPEELRAQGAMLKDLILDGSAVKKLCLERVQIDGGLSLRAGFRTNGEVRLLNAKINGNLSGTGGTFDGNSSGAIFADQVQVGGSVMFRDGFHAIGMVWFPSATIGGDFDCGNGKFDGKGDISIHASGSRVAGSVMLCNGFFATDLVRLLGATIQKNLDCTRGGFDGPLDLDRVSVNGAFFFNPLSAPSKVDMTSARVWYMHDELGAWPPDINFTDYEYRAIYPGVVGSLNDRLEWLNKHDNSTRGENKRFDQQPYQQLAKIFRQNGQVFFAEQVMYVAAKKHAASVLAALKAEEGDRWVYWLARVWYKVYERLIGYGYRRWLPFLWMFWLIVIGTIVFSGLDVSEVFGANESYPNVMQPTQAKAVEAAYEGKSWLDEYPAFRPLAYSADAFLPLVNLHQETYWTPSHWAVKRIYLPIHILMGWIVTTLAAVSVTGLVRHEKE